jgi:hypothetical protein
LPAPDHRLFETHPIVNSQLLYCVGHGQIEVRRAIERVDGPRVTFAGGCEEEVDLIVFATGYEPSFPFLDRALVLDDHGAPKLYLNAFHPHYDTLLVAGLIQPNGAIWPLADLQAQVMARFIAAREDSPRKADWFRRQKQQGRTDLGGGLRYDASERHQLEVEFFAYRRKLRKLLQRLA